MDGNTHSNLKIIVSLHGLICLMMNTALVSVNQNL